MLVPVRCPQESVHEPIAKLGVPVQRLWGESHDQTGEVNHWITKGLRSYGRGKEGGAITDEGSGG